MVHIVEQMRPLTWMVRRRTSKVWGKQWGGVSSGCPSNSVLCHESIDVRAGFIITYLLFLYLLFTGVPKPVADNISLLHFSLIEVTAPSVLVGLYILHCHRSQAKQNLKPGLLWYSRKNSCTELFPRSTCMFSIPWGRMQKYFTEYNEY